MYDAAIELDLNGISEDPLSEILIIFDLAEKQGIMKTLLVHQA